MNGSNPAIENAMEANQSATGQSDRAGLENTKAQQEPRTKLVVGLGNPGDGYVGTRHNAGFLVADALLQKALSFRMCDWQPAEGSLFEVKFAGADAFLLKPMSFMNNSGKPAGETFRKLGISPQELLVVCDDLDMPLGRLRLRTKGSSAGHRGVGSIADNLGTQDFPRLKVGIGRPRPDGDSIVDYVLSPWTSDEMPLLARTVADAAELVMTCLSGKVEGVTKECSLPDKINASVQGDTEIEKV